MDLTKANINDNPTKAIAEAYQELMQVQDPHELAQRARMFGFKGMSEKNRTRFFRNIDGIVSQTDHNPNPNSHTGPLHRLRGFLTNFILAGMGLSVNAGLRGGLRTQN